MEREGASPASFTRFDRCSVAISPPPPNKFLRKGIWFDYAFLFFSELIPSLFFFYFSSMKAKGVGA